MICFGIETGGRLVEDQDVRIVDDRLRQADALPVAFRQLRAQSVRHVGDSDARHHLPDSLAPPGGRHALDPRHEIQILFDRHVGIERRGFRQVAGPALGFDRLLEHVEPGDHGLAIGRRHVAGQNPHRRRLAGAVRAQEAEDFAALDAKADVVDGGDPAVLLGEVLDLNHNATPNVLFGRRCPHEGAPTKMLSERSPNV